MLVRQLSIAAIFVVSPRGCREQEQPKRISRKTQQLHGKATGDIFEGVIEMPRNAYVVLCILVVTVGIVVVDLLFFRHLFWERLMVNIGIVLVVVAFYLRFLKKP
jgi:uncharacterized membrane protein